MRLLVILCVLMLASKLASAGEDQRSDGVMDKTYGVAIEKVLPTAYSVFKQDTDGNMKSNSLPAALLLVAKTRQLLDSSQGTESQCWRAISAYRYGWCIALRLSGSESNRVSLTDALDKWNESLRDPSPVVAYQIQALGIEWNRLFLTPEVWELFANTNDKAVISAMAFVLYKRGDKTDMEKLAEKERALTERDLKGPIHNALIWRKHDESASAHDPGPSQSRPHVEDFGLNSTKTNLVDRGTPGRAVRSSEAEEAARGSPIKE
jgi:hypothetical protein